MNSFPRGGFCTALPCVLLIILLSGCGGEPSPAVSATGQAAAKGLDCDSQRRALVNFQATRSARQQDTLMRAMESTLDVSEEIKRKVASHRRRLQLEAAYWQCTGADQWLWLPGLGVEDPNAAGRG